MLKDKKNLLGFFPFRFTPSMRSSNSFPGQGCIFCFTMSRSSLLFKRSINYYYILYKYFIKHHKLHSNAPTFRDNRGVTPKSGVFSLLGLATAICENGCYKTKRFCEIGEWTAIHGNPFFHVE